MQFIIRYALDSFRRIQDLLDQVVALVPEVKTSEGRVKLDAAVEALHAHDTEQRSIDLEISGQSSTKESLETELKKEHLQPIAEFARGKLRGKPEYATLTRGTANLVGKPLASAAFAVAEAATPYLDDFVKGGFPADTVEQVKIMATSLVAAIDKRANLTVRRAGETEAMKTVTKEGKDAVRMLNGLVKKHFAKDSTFLASWQSAMTIALKPGLPRGAKERAAAAAASTTPHLATTVPTTSVTATPAVPAAVQGTKAA